MFWDSANHTLISDVDGDRCLLGSHEISLTYQCSISLYMYFLMEIYQGDENK